MRMLGEEESAGLTQAGTAERVFEQYLYAGQQLVLTPCERRRVLKVIVLNYFPDKEAYALGEVTDAESGLKVQQLSLKPGSSFTLSAAGGVRFQHYQPASGQGLILPILLVSAADERQYSRVQG